MEYYIKIHFAINGRHYYTRGTAPCTEKAFQSEEFSEEYIIKCAYCLINGYMEVEKLKGTPELIDWSFEYING